MLAPILLALAMQVGIRPAAPTVGDPVTLTFPIGPGGQVSLEPSSDYEVVTAAGNRVTLRSFRPGSLTLSGAVFEQGRTTKFSGLKVEIRSVLDPKDLKPSPLKPPQPLPASRRPYFWLGGAAALAAIAWGLLLVLARRRRRGVKTRRPALAPKAEFERALAFIAAQPPSETNLIALAEATRRFLSRVQPRLGPDLTTSELLDDLRHDSRARGYEGLLAEVLGEADLAKFSPYGPRNRDSATLARNSRALVALAEPVEEGAA